MTFVRVTDPELAAELYANGLLYEEYVTETGPDTIDAGHTQPLVAAGWGGHTPWEYRLDYKDWQFYMLLEE